MAHPPSFGDLSPPLSRLTRRTAISALIFVVAAAWAGLVWRDLHAARSAALEAIDLAEAAVDLGAGGDLDGSAVSLRLAADRLDAADARLRRPTVDSIAWMPVATTEVAAARSGVAAASDLVAAALLVADYVQGDHAPILDGARIDLDTLAGLRDALRSAEPLAVRARERLEPLPRSRVSGIRRRLTRLSDAAAAAERAFTAAGALAERAHGAASGGEPYDILLLIENGAELRATAGLMGVTALIQIADRELRLARAQVVHDLTDRAPDGEYIAVPAPADYSARYGQFLANTTLWLNVNLSPHFPSVAEVAAGLYEEVTGIAPDAVARIDLVALGSILRAFPPISLPDGTLDPNTLGTEFILESYRRFPDPDDQSAYLAEVMTIVFDEVLGGAGGDAGGMLGALRSAVEERRFAVVTGDPDIDRALAGAGADGSLLPGEPGDVEIIVQNFGANKIDLFTETSIEVTTDTHGCEVSVTTVVTLGNRLPPGLSFLQQGTAGESGVWWVSLFLPNAARVADIQVDGRTAGGSLDSELGRPVLSFIMEASRGEDTTAEVRWTEVAAPRTSDYVFRIAPQPHLVPATIAFDDGPPAPFTTEVGHAVPLEC